MKPSAEQPLIDPTNWGLLQEVETGGKDLAKQVELQIARAVQKGRVDSECLNRDGVADVVGNE